MGNLQDLSIQELLRQAADTLDSESDSSRESALVLIYESLDRFSDEEKSSSKVARLIKIAGGSE